MIQEVLHNMVSTVVERLSSCKVQFQISMPAEQVDTIRKSQEKLVQRQAQIQGFRKGHAPMHLVKNMYAGTIEKNTLDEAMQQAFEESLRESEIDPVGYPVIKKFDFDDQKNLTMDLEIETYPEIELKNYKNLKLDKTVYSIGKEDVEENIDYIRKQKAIISAVSEPAKKGDYVTFSVQEIDESGMPLVGKKYDDMRIQLGEEQFDADLEAQISGVKAGEERVLEKRYPASAGPNLAGKTERYKINVKTVENEEWPALDDQFVQDLNLDLKTVEELQAKVHEELQNRWGQESEQRFYHNLAQELLHQNPFDVPDTMIENYLDKVIEDIHKREKNFDEEEVRKHYRADAVFNIKWYHLKEKIAKVEKISAGDEDFEEFLSSLKDEQTRKLYESNPELKKHILSDIYEKKIFDFLVSQSKVKEKKESIRKRKEFGDV